MINLDENYCYYISKNKIVCLLTSEIVDYDNIFLLAEDEKIKCSYMDKETVYYFSQRFHKYSFNIIKSIDITYKHSIEIHGKIMPLDHSQYLKTKEFRDEYTYTLSDLGQTYNTKYSSFKVWTPLARNMKILVFEDEKTEEYKTYEMEYANFGIWRCEIEGDLANKYYLYEAEVFGKKERVIDVYAKAIGINGEKAAIINMAKTDPVDFREHTFERVNSITEAIIYETHIRDFNSNDNSSVKNKGKYIGMTEVGTKNDYGQSTCFDHVVELGVNYIQLLPFFDFANVDETKELGTQYNWGYEPENFNAPEGSYASDPYKAEVRIREVKEMIKQFHKRGIGVLMDISFSHVFEINESNHQKIVPNYYYRTDNFGNVTTGSGCNNELASERTMVRKHIVDSVVFWAKEYRVDGFRFNNMKLHDINTMNQIRMELDKIDSKIIMYGEDVAVKPTPLNTEIQSTKANAGFLSNRIGIMSINLRNKENTSYLNKEGVSEANVIGINVENLKYSIIGSVNHPDVNINNVVDYDRFWSKSPRQIVNLTSYHSGLTLWDSIKKGYKDYSIQDMIKLNKMAFFTLAISQGGLLFQSGEEFARSKRGEENSYNGEDIINAIDWNKKAEFNSLTEYYKGLINIRKSDRAFRLNSQDEVVDNIKFITSGQLYLVIRLNSFREEYSHYIAIINGTTYSKFFSFDKNKSYYKIVDNNRCSQVLSKQLKKVVEVKPFECVLLVQPKEVESKKGIRNKIIKIKDMIKS